MFYNISVIGCGVVGGSVLKYFNEQSNCIVNGYDKYKNLGVKTYKISVNKNGDLDLKKALIKARKLGFSRIFLESGLKLAGNFLKEDLVNDLKFFISNKMLNKNGNGSIRKYFTTILKKRKFKVEKVNLFSEKLISYRMK